MPAHSTTTALLAAGVLAALAVPGAPSLDPRVIGVAPSDTLPADWMADVTMEPILAVVPRDQRIEAVTTEPIRVVIPRTEGAGEPSEYTPRR